MYVKKKKKTNYSQLPLRRHCRDLELVSSLARVRNSESLFQSIVRIIGVSIIAGCPQCKSWLYNITTLYFALLKYWRSVWTKTQNWCASLSCAVTFPRMGLIQGCSQLDRALATLQQCSRWVSSTLDPNKVSWWRLVRIREVRKCMVLRENRDTTISWRATD